MLFITFTLLFVDMFDTVGSLIGVASKANMLDANGNLPRAKQVLLADAIGTSVGAVLGTSTVTTYIESASVVAEGGRTGLTALTVAILFFIALFFAPLFLMVPQVATAPDLVIVGAFIISPLSKIALNDFTETVPVFLTMIMMPLTYSIAEGIAFGLLSYVLLKALTFRLQEVTLTMWVLALLFLLKFIS